MSAHITQASVCSGDGKSFLSHSKLKFSEVLDFLIGFLTQGEEVLSGDDSYGNFGLNGKYYLSVYLIIREKGNKEKTKGQKQGHNAEVEREVEIRGC